MQRHWLLGANVGRRSSHLGLDALFNGVFVCAVRRRYARELGDCATVTENASRAGGDAGSGRLKRASECIR